MNKAAKTDFEDQSPDASDPPLRQQSGLPGVAMPDAVPTDSLQVDRQTDALSPACARWRPIERA